MVGLALILSVAGCAGSGPDGSVPAQHPAESATDQATGGMPAPADLVRGASTFRKLLGSQVYELRNAWVDGHTLHLQSPYFPDPGDPPPKDPLNLRAAATASHLFAYGIFLFGDVGSNLATLEIETGFNKESRIWVAFADWDRNAWDFSHGWFFDNPTLDISDVEKFDPYRDEEGRIAVAIIVDDPAEEILIHALELTLLSEVSALEANNFRWDGVELTWESPSSTDGFRVLRRRADDLTGPWTPTHTEPLGRYDREFVDTQSVPGVEYTYLCLLYTSPSPRD